MTTGNADSLGPIRQTELLSSTLILGLRSTSDVFVLDSPNFPNTMASSWEDRKIASVLVSVFAPSFSSSSSSVSPSTSQPPAATIDVLITFDRHRISGHPNHQSLYHGAITFLRALMRTHPGWACPVTLYTLTLTVLVRKYMSVLNTP
ncbi:N-acetylglucosaminyl-phosphatidylinositol de-N-acetylase, partial [Acarospora aff. strigata]|nr:N-acetylglucosaminyl-phosphatidylinositol de-N-acetylase [Acarospora aff. strigata]